MAESIQDCVMRAYYTQANASVQLSALSMCAGHQAVTGGAAPTIQYLSESEREGAKDMTMESCMRPWALWVKEVEAQPLYVLKD